MDEWLNDSTRDRINLAELHGWGWGVVTMVMMMAMVMTMSRQVDNHLCMTSSTMC